MKISIDKLAIDYFVSKDEFALVLDHFESIGCGVKRWSDNSSPYHECASIKYGNSEGIFIGDHVKRIVPEYKNGKYLIALRLQFNPSKLSEVIVNEIKNLHNALSSFEWSLPRIDVAMDFPTKMKNIFVICKIGRGKVTCKTTKYYGKRESDGCLKVYDKGLEMSTKGLKVQDFLTRVEYTYKPKSKEGRKIGELLVKQNICRRYHIINIETATEDEKANLINLAKRKKSSLSKSHKKILNSLVKKFTISFKIIDNVIISDIHQILDLKKEDIIAA